MYVKHQRKRNIQNLFGYGAILGKREKQWLQGTSRLKDRDG
jgi:hypothetical protein